MRLSVSPGFSRAILGGHSLLGVIFGALVFLMCVSGTLSVLSDEFIVWETPDVPTVTAASPELLARVAVDADAAARREKIAHDLFVVAPTAELPRIAVTAYDHGRSHLFNADATGRLVDSPATPWVTFLRDLHFNFNLGTVGRYLVGIIGTLLLASLVTGVLAHRRILKDAFRLRWGGSKRLANADLHNRVGIWALPFHLIVSLTGSLLGLSGLIIMILAYVAFQGDTEKAIAALLGPQAVKDARAAPLPDPLPMVAQIQQRLPGAEVTSIFYEHVGTRGQRVVVSVAAPGHLTRGEAWTFDGNGRFVWKAGYTDGSLGMRINGMIQPLHYGTYGGIWLKGIYLLLGTGLCTLVASGCNIWLARRRDQGRAAPRLERLWTSLVWIQPLAWSASAFVAQLGASPLLTYWGLILAALTAGLWVAAPRRIARSLQLAGGAACIGLAAFHVATAGTGTAFSVIVDLGIAVTGTILLLLSGVLRLRSPRIASGARAHEARG